MALAVFTTCNKGYFRQALMALHLMSAQLQVHHPQHTCFVVTADTPSPALAKLADAWHIQFLRRDFRAKYRGVVAGTRWPNECAWYFEMPQEFATMGYRAALYLDGDVIAVEPVQFACLSDLAFTFAAKRKYHDRGLNSGVLLFDTAYAARIDLSGVVSAYVEGGGARYPGDQRFLNVLVQQGALKLSHELADAYNYIIPCADVGHARNHKNDCKHAAAVCIYHMLAKPWHIASKDIAFNYATGHAKEAMRAYQLCLATLEQVPTSL